MAFAPYDARELARLRHLASRDDLGAMVNCLLATVAQVEAERDALRAAASALVDALDGPRADAPSICMYCLRYGVETPAVAVWRHACGHYACDRHAVRISGPSAPIELSYAAPLRALRALLGGDR